MPAKRRLPKARTAAPQAPLEAWEAVFAWGRDYFNDLGPCGVDATDPEAVKAAWQAYGAAFLHQWEWTRPSYYADDLTAKPWALIHLGEPL